MLNGVASCHSNQLTLSQTVSILIHDSTPWCNSKWFSCSFFVNYKKSPVDVYHSLSRVRVLRIIESIGDSEGIFTRCGRGCGLQTLRRKANYLLRSITSFFKRMRFKNSCASVIESC
jgi:hypothetical protein